MHMKTKYSKPETFFLVLENQPILVISVDGHIKDMDEEGGDYDDGGSGGTKGGIDPWGDGYSF